MNDSKADEDEYVKYKRAAFMEALDEQLANPETPEVKQQYERLIGMGIEEEEVRRMMASCFAVMMWHTLREDAYTYQDYIEDLSGLPDNESGHEGLLPAKSGVPLSSPEGLDDPFFSALLAEIENAILKHDRHAKFRRVTLNDSQIRSTLTKVRKAAEGGKPKVSSDSERDQCLAALFEELVKLQTLLFEEIPEKDPVALTTRDWVLALRVTEDTIRTASIGRVRVLTWITRATGRAERTAAEGTIPVAQSPLRVHGAARRALRPIHGARLFLSSCSFQSCGLLPVSLAG